MRLSKRQGELLQDVYDHAPGDWGELWSLRSADWNGAIGFINHDRVIAALIRKKLVVETGEGLRLTVTGAAVLMREWERDERRKQGVPTALTGAARGL